MARTAPYQIVYVNPFFEIPQDVANVKPTSGTGGVVTEFTGASQTGEALGDINLDYSAGGESSEASALNAPTHVEILDQVIVRGPGGSISIDVMVDTPDILGASEIVHRVSIP